MVLQHPATRAGDPPPRPARFDESYTLPVHTDYPLARINWFPQDDALTFHEEPHVYVYEGKCVAESMTSVVHAGQTAFEPHAAIHLMKTSRGQCWPRLAYTVDAQPCDDWSTASPDRGVLAVSGDRTVAVCRAYDFGSALRGTGLVEALLEMCARPPATPPSIYTFEREMTVDEIIAHWSANGMDARNRGTEAHLQMQLMVEGCPYRADDVEVTHVARMFARVDHSWRAFRTEWEIYDPSADVAGSIDLVVATGGAEHDLASDGAEPTPLRVIIVDYKRTKDLRSKMRSSRKQKAPLSHLDDCDGAVYALQLSGYQHILERVYGLTVVDRVLISMHPDYPWCTSVPYLKDEIEYLMQQRRHRVAARATCPDRCPFSDVALHDPVVVAGGDVVDRKHALVQGWSITGVHEETRQRVQEHEEARGAEPAPMAVSKAWRDLMPAHGLPCDLLFGPG